MLTQSRENLLGSAVMTPAPPCLRAAAAATEDTAAAAQATAQAAGSMAASPTFMASASPRATLRTLSRCSHSGLAVHGTSLERHSTSPVVHRYAAALEPHNLQALSPPREDMISRARVPSHGPPGGKDSAPHTGMSYKTRVLSPPTIKYLEPVSVTERPAGAPKTVQQPVLSVESHFMPSVTVLSQSTPPFKTREPPPTMFKVLDSKIMDCHARVFGGDAGSAPPRQRHEVEYTRQTRPKHDHETIRPSSMLEGTVEQRIDKVADFVTAMTNTMEERFANLRGERLELKLALEDMGSVIDAHATALAELAEGRRAAATAGASGGGAAVVASEGAQDGEGVPQGQHQRVQEAIAQQQEQHQLMKASLDELWQKVVQGLKDPPDSQSEQLHLLSELGRQQRQTQEQVDGLHRRLSQQEHEAEELQEQQGRSACAANDLGELVASAVNGTQELSAEVKALNAQHEQAQAAVTGVMKATLDDWRREVQGSIQQARMELEGHIREFAEERDVRSRETSDLRIALQAVAEKFVNQVTAVQQLEDALHKHCSSTECELVDLRAQAETVLLQLAGDDPANRELSERLLQERARLFRGLESERQAWACELGVLKGLLQRESEERARKVEALELRAAALFVEMEERFRSNAKPADDLQGEQQSRVRERAEAGPSRP